METARSAFVGKIFDFSEAIVFINHAIRCEVVRDCSAAVFKALFIQLLKTHIAVIKTSLKTCNK